MKVQPKPPNGGVEKVGSAKQPSNMQLSKTPQNEVSKSSLSPYSDSSHSTFSLANLVGTFFSVISWPLRNLGKLLTNIGSFLKSCLFFWSGKGSNQKFDPKKARECFEKIFASFRNIKDKTTDRTKVFVEGMEALSSYPEAKELFIKHLLEADFRNQKSKSKATAEEVEKYIQENKAVNIDERYLYNKDGSVRFNSIPLQNAVNNFHEYLIKQIDAQGN